MTPHDAIQLFAKMLENLDRWLDKADEHAKERSFDVDVLAQARLAPDQFTFGQQVQSACDQAKYAAAYLGTDPRHARNRSRRQSSSRRSCRAPRVP